MEPRRKAVLADVDAIDAAADTFDAEYAAIEPQWSEWDVGELVLALAHTGCPVDPRELQ